jgi:DNA-binding MarR family transcriptional regulator
MKTELTFREYTLLKFLANNQGIRSPDLFTSLKMNTANNISTVVSNLERRKLVNRLPVEENKINYKLYITELGKEKIKKLETLWSKI